jgi:hypothetical protein
MRLKVISCEVLFREIAMLAARSPNQVDLEFLPKGLHDMRSVRMRDRLQQTLDAVDATKYDAVVFGYALCGKGLVGLTARSIPVVLPRGHDCITFFMGGRQRYGEYFVNNPGVYFKTSGWIERGNSGTQQLFGDSLEFDAMVEKYGEDNARYLMEELHGYKKTYRQFTYISMGVEPDDRFERATREEASARGWQFEKMEGDISLLAKLVNGDWDDDFLVVPPGWHVTATHDDQIVAACPPPESNAQDPDPA